MVAVASQLLVTDLIGIITAIGVLLTGIATVRNRQRIQDVHEQVKTSNGLTIGELAEDSNERIKSAGIYSGEEQEKV